MWTEQLHPNPPPQRGGLTRLWSQFWSRLILIWTPSVPITGSKPLHWPGCFRLPLMPVVFCDMNVLKHYLTPADLPAVHIRGPLNSAEVRSRSVSTWHKISRLCSMTARGFVVYQLELYEEYPNDICSHMTFPYSFLTVWVKPLQTQTSSSAKLLCIILSLTRDNRPLGVNPTYIWKCLVLISIPFIEMCSNCRFLHSDDPKFVLRFQFIRIVCLMIHREVRLMYGLVLISCCIIVSVVF